ncbi:MAG: hypothetical protein JNK25_13930 [Phycisphaerae bacterium]|nr:hypothetical protein [Phycisphaerae bacterium]
MDVTAQLLRVYHVDKQIRGLQSRLGTAEKFLQTQVKELALIDARMAALGSTLTQQTVIAADQEGETKRLDERMAVIRGQMDKAQTNKEYQAFLTELNTYKAQRDKFETTAIEALAKAEEIRKQLADLEVVRADREKVREHAAKEREERFKEIEGRLNELKSERAACVAEVPSNVMSMFQRLLDLRGDSAMGTVEVIDRKRHEYNCSACMMAIPIDAVSGLISNGRLTRCSSCECVLFLDETAQAALKPGGKKSAKSA